VLHLKTEEQKFLDRHSADVIGVLAGFDRVLFRGSLLTISYAQGMDRLMHVFKIPFSGYKAFVLDVSKKLKEHVLQYAEQQGRPLIPLDSPTQSKEEVALRVLKDNPVREGLICILTCVEQCQTFAAHGNPKTKLLELQPARRRCLFYYFYYLDPAFGLMHVRLQSWLPLTIQVCLNGREYLARRLDQEGIGYDKRDNCFVHVDNLPRAQALLDELLDYDWQGFLTAYAHCVNPWSRPDNALGLRDYYWTFRQTEYATDVLFRDEKALAHIYPALVRHAVEQFDCPNLLRFLGRRNLHSFRGKATTDRQCYPEGIRVKHRIDENFIKMYDKQGSVLRIETLIENPRRFYVYRPVTRKGHERLAWVRMRKGLADLHRRVAVSRTANERYLDALAVVGKCAPTCEILDPVSRPVKSRGRRYRALRPLDKDEARLFAALLRGEFLIVGFRNRDLRTHLCPQNQTPLECRHASARITRQLRLMRAHGLIRKVPRTFSYRVTPKGQHLMTTALKVRALDIGLLAA
jgi:hypothetical protein